MWPASGREKRRAGEGGQSLVEFALGLVVLLLLIFGIIDFGRAAFARNAVASMAREGARYAIVHPAASEADIATVAKAAVVGLDDDELEINVTNPDAYTVQVEVVYTFHVLTPLVGQFIEGSLDEGIVLRGCSIMTIERRD